MLRCLGIACILLSAAARDDYSSAALKDEVKQLPGAPFVSFKLFSGYIDVSRNAEAAGTRQMFYWFVESESSPARDPVFLWTNGGPGCSGLGGFFTEQGPFRPEADGTLVKNDFAWNKVVNMIFIEQPVGVGFSTVKGQIHYGDADAAQDNAAFAKGFFQKFPQYASQDFYISSESYGGHYMPTLAQALLQSKALPNFKGVFLGNPLTYMPYRNYGQYGTAYGHQLLPKVMWDKYEEAGCRTAFPPTPACGNITDAFDTLLAGFDPYALDFPVCTSKLAAGREERRVMRDVIRRANFQARGELALALGSEPYQPCAENFMTTYLNRQDVQVAIGVVPGSKWSMCAAIDYSIDDVNSPMMPVWSWILKNSDLDVMIYSGDDDSVCATLGTQQFIWNGIDGVKAVEGKEWKVWQVEGQNAGFASDFAVEGSRATFRFVTVHGAGHMVPATQPERSLALLKIFLGKGEEMVV